MKSLSSFHSHHIRSRIAMRECSREPSQQRRNASFSSFQRIRYQPRAPRAAAEELARAYGSFRGNYDCRETRSFLYRLVKAALPGWVFELFSTPFQSYQGSEDMKIPSKFQIYLFGFRCTVHIAQDTFIGYGCGKVKSYQCGSKHDTSLHFLCPSETLFAKANIFKLCFYSHASSFPCF